MPFLLRYIKCGSCYARDVSLQTSSFMHHTFFFVALCLFSVLLYAISIIIMFMCALLSYISIVIHVCIIHCASLIVPFLIKTPIENFMKHLQFNTSSNNTQQPNNRHLMFKCYVIHGMSCSNSNI